MAKDILLFGYIWEGNALYFFDQVQEALEEDPEAELVLRMNTEGGQPDYGMSIVEKAQEMSSQILLKVGMSAHSTGFFIIVACNPERIECVDLTTCVLHRAAYPDWMESSEHFKDSVHSEILVKVNKQLEKMLRNKVDVALLESLPQLKEKNITVKDIFSLDQRIDVLLTAADLKKLGLVSKINKITPSKKSEIAAMTDAFGRCRSLNEFKIAASAQSKEKSKPETTMDELTLESLKSDFPAIYDAVLAAGKKEGKDAEVKRVKAWAAWAKVDPERVEKGISEGTEMSMDIISELSAKAANSAALKKVEDGNPGADAESEDESGERKEKKAPAADTGEATTEKKKTDNELTALSADVDKLLGLKKGKAA